MGRVTLTDGQLNIKISLPGLLSLRLLLQTSISRLHATRTEAIGDAGRAALAAVQLIHAFSRRERPNVSLQ